MTTRAPAPPSRKRTRPRPPPRGQARRASAAQGGGRAFAVVAVATAVVFGLAFLLTRNDTTPEAVTQTRGVTVAGTALPPYPQAGADPAEGMKLALLSGESFDGSPMTIAPTGRPKVVIFLAHWCPHCQNEVRTLGPHLRDNGLPEGVDLVSVSTAVDRAKGNYPPSTWLTDARWPVAVMADDATSSAGVAAGVSSYPFWVFLDGDGTVVARFAGEMGTDAFEARVAALRTAGGSS